MANTFINNCSKGTDQTLYYNTSTIESPVWVEHLGVVEDLDMNETEEVTELTGRRISRQTKEYNEGQVELSITGSHINDPDYEGWQYLNAARTGGSPKDICCLTGKITVIGVYGWRGLFWNSDRTSRGPVSGNLLNAFNLQPAAPCNDNVNGEVRVVKVGTPGETTPYDPTVIV